MTAVDAARLREAIERCRKHDVRWDDQAVLIAAAEALLSTLPKTATRFRVTGEGPKIRQAESFSTRDAAGKFAAYLVESGFDHITIHVEQVLA